MKLKSLIVFLFVNLSILSQPHKVILSGKLINEKNLPLEYANISLQKTQDTDYITGTFSEEEGLFKIEAIHDEYILRISAIGYEKFEKRIILNQDLDLGEILIQSSTILLDEIVINSQRIIRTSDRFIINLMNDPTIIGKSATDILNFSPGVFIQENHGGISINGKTGTRVIINERLLHEQGAELIQYLQTLNAEDILRIEVLPSASAEYDADMAGGVIKIKMRNQRFDGIDGSFNTRYTFSPVEDVFTFLPSFRLNYRNNKISIYTSLNHTWRKTLEKSDDEVQFNNLERISFSKAEAKLRYNNTRLKIGSIYEIDHKQSFGLEFNYSPDIQKNRTPNHSYELEKNERTEVNSLFTGDKKNQQYSVSTNYILELDTLGSLFKVLLDYYNNDSKNHQDYNSVFEGYINLDSLYRSDISTLNNLYVINVDMDLKMNPATSLKTGLKYSHSKMDNTILFDYWNKQTWNIIETLSSQNTFSENVYAAYGVFSTAFKNNISINLGIRGEYTYSNPWSNQVEKIQNQNYFKLFPTVNFLFPLNQDGSNFLILNYNKKIRRPTFNDLNPYRIPTSEYSFLEGNPHLEPSISHDYSLSLGILNTYNIVVGMTEIKNDFSRIATTEINDPRIMILKNENVSKNSNYYINVDIPFEPFEWWNVETNLLGTRNTVNIQENKKVIYSFMGSIDNTFTLPKNYYLDIDAFYMSPTLSGNIKTLSAYRINSYIRKSFLNKQLSTSIYISDIFNSSRVKMIINEKEFNRHVKSQWGYREIGISLRYNFKTGKSFNIKNIESGAREEASRL